MVLGSIYSIHEELKLEVEGFKEVNCNEDVA